MRKTTETVVMRMTLGPGDGLLVGSWWSALDLMNKRLPVAGTACRFIMPVAFFA